MFVLQARWRVLRGSWRAAECATHPCVLEVRDQVHVCRHNLGQGLRKGLAVGALGETAPGDGACKK